MASGALLPTLTQTNWKSEGLHLTQLWLMLSDYTMHDTACRGIQLGQSHSFPLVGELFSCECSCGHEFKVSNNWCLCTYREWEWTNKSSSFMLIISWLGETSFISARLQKAWNYPRSWVQVLVMVFPLLIYFHHIYEFPKCNDWIAHFTFSSESTH